MEQEGFSADLPRCLVFVSTLGCTARCRDCCFSASPGKANQRLRLQEMLEILDAVVETVPSVENVVFTGGEPFLLREDLVTAVGAAAKRGLGTRIVTNGFWSRTPWDAES